MKNGKLTAAQIGCGKFSFYQDFPNMTGHPEVELKYACDVNLENAERAGKQFGIPLAVDDYRKVFADPEVDFVKIATSHNVHLEIIEAAAAAGKHVFCEKPMGMDDLECYKIIRAVRKGKIKFCVDYNRRMAPSMRALKERWQDQCRNPTHNPWRYIETSREMFPEEDQTHLMIRVQDESSSYGMGHFDPLVSGTSTMVMGETVHWLDLACWFFAPQIPVEITAWGSSRLSHGIYLKFSGGDDVTMTFATSGTFDFPKELYEVASKAAFFRNLFFVENNYYGMRDCSPEFFPMQAYHGNIKEEGYSAYMAKYKERTEIGSNLKAFESTKPFHVDKGHKHMLDGFIKAIKNDTATPCDEIDGFRATCLGRLIIQSIHQRQTLPVPIEMITPRFVY